MAILTSYKIDFKTEIIIRDKEGHCVMIQRYYTYKVLGVMTFNTLRGEVGAHFSM